MKAGWTEVALGEVAALVRDVVEPSAISDGTLYVGLENIERGGAFADVSPVANGELASAKFAFNASHILYGKLRPNLGKVSRPQFVGVCSTDILPIAPGPRIDRNYLFHFLSRPATVEFAARRATGANLPRLAPNELMRFRLPLPSLDDQRRIADVLDRAAKLRAKRRQAIVQLDSLIQATFHDMFARSSNGRSVRAPLPDAFWFQEGPGIRTWQFTAEGVKVLNVGNIERGGRLNLSTTSRYISNSEANGRYKHFLVDEGDLVIASSGISFDQDGLLRTRGAFVHRDHLPLCMNTSTIRFKALPGASDLRYLRAWIDSRDFRQQITTRVTGSAQQNFGPTHLAALTIDLPPLPLQLEFGTRVDAIETVRGFSLSAVHELDALIASLQHRAFMDEL